MTKETFVRAHELAEQISSTRWYDFDVCKEFCELAGMNERWNQLVAIDVIPATIPDENDEAYPKFVAGKTLYGRHSPTPEKDRGG